MLVIDNAFFHHSSKIVKMSSEAAVKLVFLPPYSPNLNPIEEGFAEPKAFIRRNWQSFRESSEQRFDNFLDGVLTLSVRGRKSAEGHFRHAGLVIQV